MSAPFTRRTFIGVASTAAFGVATAGRPASGQSTWVLTADVIPMPEGFSLSVTFDLGSPPSEPLFVQIANSEDVDVFFTWDQITEPSGTEVVDFGPFDLPYGGTYLVSIVNSSGQPDPSSPLVQVEAPELPEATFD